MSDDQRYSQAKASFGASGEDVYRDFSLTTENVWTLDSYCLGAQDKLLFFWGSGCWFFSPFYFYSIH